MLYAIYEWLMTRHGSAGLMKIMGQLEFRALAAAGLAFVIVLLLGQPTIDWLRRKKIGDSGATDAAALKEHNASKANTPTMGGILIVGAITASVMLLADLSVFYVVLGLAVVLFLAVLGGFDDWLKLTAKSRGSGSRQGLHAWEKLVFQLGFGLIVGYFCYKQGPDANDLRHVLNLPFQRTYEGLERSLNPNMIWLGLIAFMVLTALMISGMSNAVNITDGMDGLAAGVCLSVAIGAAILAFIAGEQSLAQRLLVPYVPGSEELAVLAAATAGACLGFLWWNCWPAQVFMGDTGALALGGVLGYIAVVTRQEFVVLLMSGVCLIEIGSVVIQVSYFKATKGKRIFKVAPYHHHLHKSGWLEQQVVARLWIVSVLLVVVALATIKMR